MRRKTGHSSGSRLKKMILALIIVGIGTGIGMLFTPFFHISEVYCEGNNRIAREEILEAAQVQAGKNIFLQRISEIRKRVAAVPMVEKVHVNRVFPNKIRILVTECVPAACIYTDHRFAVLDLSGKVLEMVDDGRVEKLVAMYTPAKVETEKADQKEKTDEKSDESGETPNPSATPGPSATPEPTADSASDKEEGENLEKQQDSEKEQKESEPAQEETVEMPYRVPVVVGLGLEKPEPGKTADSRERDKLSQALDAFRCLEKTGLLERATYLDLTNINDVVLVIENRLQVQLGTLHNMEYRSTFLAKVINERIGAAEEAVMDYRGADIYVRPPEDGKARMIPKPSSAPKSGTEPAASSAPSAKPTETADRETDREENEDESENVT